MINDFSNIQGPKSCAILEKMKTQIYTQIISPSIKNPTEEKLSTRL